MPQVPAKQFSGIFVSYRRDDSSGHAGRLSDRLVEHFGRDRIFMDIDTIEPGEDFVTVIENAVGSCEVLIAIIGRHWLSSPGGTTGRLDNPNDFVRLEIAAALNRDTRVIPVLVQRASMPKPKELPDDLAKLTRRNAVELNDLRWQSDVDQLIKAIERILDERRETRGGSLHQDEEYQRPARAVAGLAPSAAEATTHSAGPQANDMTGWAQRNRRLLIVGMFIVVIVIAAALLGLKWGWTTRQPDAQTTNTASENTNTLSATNGSQTEKHKNSPVAPAGMAYVAGGEFMMGRDDGDEYERPAHKVTVKPFFVDIYEVTNEEYANFLKATNQLSPPTWVDGTYPAGTARKPVTGVKWDDARAYAAWAKKRLPTEEEWEFAARGTDRRLYPWGNDWHTGLANADGASNHLTDVGGFKGTSPFGAFDMVGNAWEWTVSEMKAYPGGRLPTQPASGTIVLRGGSYKSNKTQATATYRLGWRANEESSYAETGFRCIKDSAADAQEK